MTAPGQADEYTPTDDDMTKALRALWRNTSLTGSRDSLARVDARFDSWLAARDRAVREAALEGINKIIDKHPLNGRYGFTRDDVIQQLMMQAGMTGAEAFGSQSRGASRMMMKQETAIYLALFTEAAIRAAANQTGEEHGHQ